MSEYYVKVRTYLLELGYTIVQEDQTDEVFVIESENEGINKMVIGIAEPILIMEQYLAEIKSENKDVYMQLLKKNRDIVHGALALDESGKKIIFRDTLQIENLDLNEIQASIQSLSLLLGEFSDELISFSKN